MQTVLSKELKVRHSYKIETDCRLFVLIGMRSSNIRVQHIAQNWEANKKTCMLKNSPIAVHTRKLAVLRRDATNWGKKYEAQCRKLFSWLYTGVICLVQATTYVSVTIIFSLISVKLHQVNRYPLKPIRISVRVYSGCLNIWHEHTVVCYIHWKDLMAPTVNKIEVTISDIEWGNIFVYLIWIKFVEKTLFSLVSKQTVKNRMKFFS